MEFGLDRARSAAGLAWQYTRVKPPARVERWGLRLMAFKGRVIHVRGEANISGYFTSRHPRQSTNDDRLCCITEQYINNTISHWTPKAVSSENIRTETRRETTLQNVPTARTADCKLEISK